MGVVTAIALADDLSKDGRQVDDLGLTGGTLCAPPIFAPLRTYSAKRLVPVSALPPADLTETDDVSASLPSLLLLNSMHRTKAAATYVLTALCAPPIYTPLRVQQSAWCVRLPCRFDRVSTSTVVGDGLCEACRRPARNELFLLQQGEYEPVQTSRNSLRSEESEHSAFRNYNATLEPQNWPLLDLSGSDAVSASLPPLLLRT